MSTKIATARRVEPDASPSRRRFSDSRTPRRRLLADRVARLTVTGGGLTIIASVLGILVFILIEVLPLLSRAEVRPGRSLHLGAVRPAAVLCDDYRTHAAVLDEAGTIRVVTLDGGEVVLEESLLPAEAAAGDALNPPERTLAPVGHAGTRPLFVAATSAGRVVARRLDWDVSFDADARRIAPVLEPPVLFELDAAGAVPRAFVVASDERRGMSVAAVLPDGRLVVVHRGSRENFLTGEPVPFLERAETRLPVAVDVLALDAVQQNLFGGNAGGDVLWWRLDEGQVGEPQIVASGEHGGVTALALLVGDRSLVVGRDDGTLEIWFPVPTPDGARLTRIRAFDALVGPIRAIAPSRRDQGFLALAESGRMGLFHSTSERTLWTGTTDLPEPSGLIFAPKADGALVVAHGRVAELQIANPHPQVSFTALFGKVWYEGYDAPGYVWQSTGGTDEFEPKLSLTPLMVGTLKGTIYSLFLAIPLGVLGAMYASQFMHHRLRRYVKPTVEIMAALPSVVLGFLAGLWLAPRLERVMPGLLLMPVVLPVLVVLAGFAGRQLPRHTRNRFPVGLEALMQVVVVAIGAFLCLRLSPGLEAALFGGRFQDWLHTATGLAVDQRNAVVVGLAMGFAVIPIIFSIAEDAFSNVPRNLVSGSLALGANRWQTVTRVVLPSASAGIFSALMIGFGRAVGETMIVLMATGNTPIMDWNPFNGFRTLSANIAVEIPEAPHGATLYRTLFLAALILFLFTFTVNTIADLVRQRLRRRYAQI